MIEKQDNTQFSCASPDAWKSFDGSQLIIVIMKEYKCSCVLGNLFSWVSKVLTNSCLAKKVLSGFRCIEFVKCVILGSLSCSFVVLFIMDKMGCWILYEWLFLGHVVVS